MTYDQVASLADRFGRLYNLSPAFLLAVAHRESGLDKDEPRAGFNEWAVSPAGAIGIWQLMRRGAIADWEAAGHESLNYWEPEANGRVAAWYLGVRIPELLSHYGKPRTMENVLWAYNGGIGNLVKGRLPAETRDYIEVISSRVPSGEWRYPVYRMAGRELVKVGVLGSAMWAMYKWVVEVFGN